MPVRAQLADGTTLEFPDGTKGAIVDRAVRQHIAQAKRSAEYGVGDLVESKATFGIADRVKALGRAVGGEVRELRGKVPEEDFGSRYDTALSAERGARKEYQARRPVVNAVTAPVGIFAGAPAATLLSAGRAAAVSGGIGGAVSAAGESEGTIKQQAGQVATGAALGAGLGYGLSRVLPPISDLAQRGYGRLRDFMAAPPAARGVVAAAGRQRVTMNAADVRPGLRNLQAAVEGTPVAGPVITRGIQRNVQSVDDAVQRTAQNMGTPMDVTDAGEAAQRGARNWIDRSRGVGGRLYERAERLAGRNSTVQAARALAEIDRNIAELGQTPETNAQALTILNDLRADLVDDTGAVRALPISAVRNIRTSLRDRFGSENLRGSDLERRVGTIVEEASEDIRNDLAQRSPQALAAYDRADGFWRARAGRIDGALSRILGPQGQLSAEQATARLSQLASGKGNSEALAGVIRSLPADERGDVVASVISQLGRRAPDADFSVSTFLTQYDKMTPRARAAMFGPQGTAALNDLATVSRAMVESGNRLNRSQSGNVMTYRAILGGIFGGIGYSQDGISGAAIGIGAGGYGISRLLTSPAFARWLGRGLQAAGPNAIRQHAAQLSAIAAREPLIRNEVLQLQQRIQEALSQPVRQLAAEEQNGPEVPEQPEQGGQQGDAPDPREKALTVRLGGGQ